MNRYGRGPTIGGPSKATATTLCQKCLKRGHYSYECKEVIQERPYVSRPSRTAQLANPKLVPKLREDIPQDLLRKKGVADEQLAKAALERGRKRERQSEEPDVSVPTKRIRSKSVSSVSTISTNESPSPSPIHRSRDQEIHSHQPRLGTPTQDDPSYNRARTTSTPHSERKRRRGSISSNDSYASRDQRGRANSRSTRRRYERVSQSPRGRRTENRSPHRGRGDSFVDRQNAGDGFSNNARPNAEDRNRNNDSMQRLERNMPRRERSLSPFSKRLALTQAMGR